MNEINIDELPTYSARQLKTLHQQLFGITTESNNKSYLVRKIQQRVLALKAQEATSSPAEETHDDGAVTTPEEPMASEEPNHVIASDSLAGEPVELVTVPSEHQHAEPPLPEAIVTSPEVTQVVSSPAAIESPQVDVLVPTALAETTVDAGVSSQLASESEPKQAAPVCPTCGARIRSKKAPKRVETATRARKSFRESGTRDPRIPPIGTVLTREFKGVTYTATVLAEGFEYEGKQWNSLSGIAKDITGNMWNGLLFWGLTPPPSRRKFATSPQTPDGPTLESSENEVSN